MNMQKPKTASPPNKRKNVLLLDVVEAKHQPLFSMKDMQVPWNRHLDHFEYKSFQFQARGVRPKYSALVSAIEISTRETR